MKSLIRRLLAPLIQRWFGDELDREINSRIFPHLERMSDHGYPFRSEREFQKLLLHGRLDAELHLTMIEKEGEAMPRAYGEAFRYIAYRDLNARMAMYREFAQEYALRNGYQPQTA